MKQDSPASLRRKIGTAGDLQSVVRAMKAQAAASVGQYERSVAALGDYARSVELGLGVCFRMEALHLVPVTLAPKAAVGFRAIVFGSDQGLVGRFNDLVVDHARASLARMPAPAQVWAVGERVHASLLDTDMPLLGVFAVPDSVQAIAALVDEILLTVLEESFGTERRETAAEVHLFYNRPGAGSTFAPVASGCCHWTMNGVADWRSNRGRPPCWPRRWATRRPRCVP